MARPFLVVPTLLLTLVENKGPTYDCLFRFWNLLQQHSIGQPLYLLGLSTSSLLSHPSFINYLHATQEPGIKQNLQQLYGTIIFPWELFVTRIPGLSLLGQKFHLFAFSFYHSSQIDLEER
jgi:hypothetical protein